MSDPRSAKAPCSNAYHDTLRADPKKFRRATRFSFAFWGVDEGGRDEEYQAALCNACRSTISIPARLLKHSSPQEHAARAAKVLKIVALVPPPATPDERERLARVLERWEQTDRDRFAAAAGARSPSEETWRLVVAAVRAQKTGQEIEAEDARAAELLR